MYSIPSTTAWRTSAVLGSDVQLAEHHADARAGVRESPDDEPARPQAIAVPALDAKARRQNSNAPLERRSGRGAACAMRSASNTTSSASSPSVTDVRWARLHARSPPHGETPSWDWSERRCSAIGWHAHSPTCVAFDAYECD